MSEFITRTEPAPYSTYYGTSANAQFNREVRMIGLEAEGWGSCIQVGRARPAIVHVVSVPATGQGGGWGGLPPSPPPEGGGDGGLFTTRHRVLAGSAVPSPSAWLPLCAPAGTSVRSPPRPPAVPSSAAARSRRTHGLPPPPPPRASLAMDPSCDKVGIGLIGVHEGQRRDLIDPRLDAQGVYARKSL